MDLSEYETVCQRAEKSMDGKPIRQVCIEREGQMFTICRAIPTYSCGGLPNCRQLSVFFPSYLLRCEKYRMLHAWMLFPLFLLYLIADSRHQSALLLVRNGRQRSEPSGRVCPKTFRQVFASLSSRQSAAVSFSEACPQSMRRQKKDSTNDEAVGHEETGGT